MANNESINPHSLQDDVTERTNIIDSSTRDSTDTPDGVKIKSRPQSSRQTENVNRQSPTAINTSSDNNATVSMGVEHAESQNTHVANEIHTATSSPSQPITASQSHTTDALSHRSDALTEEQDVADLLRRLPDVPNQSSASATSAQATDSFSPNEKEKTTSFNGTHEVTTHPGCQFSPDNKRWLARQFHPDQSIKKPNELEDMITPTNKVDSDILNCVQGSMIGMALGDALGAHVEFRPRQYLLENPVTDLEGGGTWGLKKGQDFIPYDQLIRYKWWYKDGYMSSTGRCFDIGAATSQSLREFERRQRQFSEEHGIPLEELDNLSDLDLLGKFNVFCSEEGVAGNGALMRLAPVPLFFWKHPIQAVEFSGVSGEITHGDRRAYDACRYYGALIVAALNGEKKEQLLDKEFYSKHKSWFLERPLNIEIMKIARGSFKKKNGYDQGIRGKGYIVNALEAALWAFWDDGDSFEKGALAAVNLGDDTDTTAAIYGQLAGAYYGYKKLPEKWVKQVYAKEFMETLSMWMVHDGERWIPDAKFQPESESAKGQHSSNS